MALDGIMFEGVTVRIRRPADYNAAAAAPLGPSMPNPNLNLAAIGMDKTQQAAVAASIPGAPVSGNLHHCSVCLCPYIAVQLPFNYNESNPNLHCHPSLWMSPRNWLRILTLSF
jgi:hypothetical protein